MGSSSPLTSSIKHLSLYFFYQKPSFEANHDSNLMLRVSGFEWLGNWGEVTAPHLE